MIFFKVSWLPYMCVIFGALGLISGEYTLLFALILIAGIVWVVHVRNKKKAQSASGASAPSVEAPVSNASAGNGGTPAQGAAFCPQCGSPAAAGNSFCNKCGAKLN